MPARRCTLSPSQVFRTPDERFRDIPDFPYAPRYGHLEGLRYAFIDETSRVLHDGRVLTTAESKNIPSEDIQWETFLCLHGQPTWSFLYRRMIPVFLTHVPQANKKYVRRRVLAPDFFGCGRSDKPTEDEFFTFDMHQDFLINFVRHHILNEGPKRDEVIAVVQDWGGILGLTLPPIFPNLFTGLLIMNTSLGLGNVPSKAWQEFHDFIKRSPNANVGGIIGRGTKHLTSNEIAAYDAPYPDIKSKASVRRFPVIVPREANMPGVASSYAALAYFTHLLPSQLRVFVAIGLKDPVLGEPVMESLIKLAFPSTGAFVTKHPDAGHFVQEWGEPIARKVLNAWAIPQGREEEVKILGVEWRPPKRHTGKAKL